MSPANASDIPKVSMTMEIYAHVLPDMQRQAATTIGALLHG